MKKLVFYFLLVVALLSVGGCASIEITVPEKDKNEQNDKTDKGDDENNEGNDKTDKGDDENNEGAEVINIPDPVFFSYCLDHFDRNKDGQISKSEVAVVRSLSLNKEKIQSLEGIAYFAALESLSCADNQLTSLDVSGCTALATLDCYSNPIEIIYMKRGQEIDISQNYQRFIVYVD